MVYSITYFEKLQKILKLAGGQQQVASVPGVPIVRNDFFVLYGDYNRYVLQFQVESVRFEENGHIVATLPKWLKYREFRIKWRLKVQELRVTSH